MAEEVREQVLQLPQFLTNIANTIRNKKGYSPDVKINAQDFNSEIESIETQKEEEEKSVDVDFSLGNQVVVPTGDKVLSKVTINKPVNLTPNNIRENVVIGGIVGALSNNDMLQARVDATNSCVYLFYQYTGNNVDYISGLDTSSCTDMSNMFANCSKLETIPLLDTSSCTDMNNMFNYCSRLTTIPLLDTSSCTNMFNMFASCSNLTTIPLLDTSSCTNMFNMFASCSRLTTIPLLDTSSCTNMSSMFASCSNLTTIPLLDTSSCTNMSNMFNSCSKLETIPQINTSSCTNMFNMFGNCSNLTTIPLLDTSSCTNMSYIFAGCSKLETIPQINTSSCTNMSSMFGNCSNLTTIDISHMKITSASNTSYFASYCYRLTKLIIRNMDTVPVLNSSAFNNCYHFKGTVNATYNPQGLKDGRIYVPDAMVDSLKSATNWSTYADIIVPLSTLEEEAQVNSINSIEDENGNTIAIDSLSYEEVE